MNRTNKIAWFVFGFLAVVIGLYPLLYVFTDGETGLLLSKSKELLASMAWNIGFYGHILFGGLALLVGWVQFSKRFRESNLPRHRLIGKIYVIAVLISGLCAGFIAFYATGGVIAKLGFFSLSILWLFFTLTAYRAIRRKDVEKHKVFMVYSYAACFAAVTLRLWMPILMLMIGSFEPAYRIVAWLCWVPNLVFAYFWVRRKGLVIG